MNDKHGSNGFLLGLLIGGAVGALVSSKKGRQILKDVADYGLEYVGNVINLDEIETILNEDEEQMMKGEMDTKAVKTEEVEDAPQPKSQSRPRLFRGLRKKT